MYPYGSMSAVRGYVLTALGALKAATADQIHRLTAPGHKDNKAVRNACLDLARHGIAVSEVLDRQAGERGGTARCAARSSCIAPEGCGRVSQVSAEGSAAAALRTAVGLSEGAAATVVGPDITATPRATGPAAIAVNRARRDRRTRRLIFSSRAPAATGGDASLSEACLPGHMLKLPGQNVYLLTLRQPADPDPTTDHEPPTTVTMGTQSPWSASWSAQTTAPTTAPDGDRARLNRISP
ncbi:hypothetical protein ACFVYV_53905 [Streptomyces mirabilis]|uniref:hypothetical protein n=1 Tax=Streptomyces mirabilis TaxID=68239 RepID=UPI0036D9B5F5